MLTILIGLGVIVAYLLVTTLIGWIVNMMSRSDLYHDVLDNFVSGFATELVVGGIVTISYGVGQFFVH